MYTHDDSGLNVLVVDDEPQIVAAVARTLRELDCNVTWFTSSPEALKAALSGEFASIISDNRMPEITGIDLLAEIKAKFPDTRRILVTGYTDSAEAIRGPI